MSRMLVRLNELGLGQHLAWHEVADIKADHEADMAAAIEQALEDHARFGVDAAQAHHFAICLELLKTVPYHTGHYESRAPYPTFERTPEPDFCGEGDVRDVDPACVE